jgi:hypothetical protein
MISSSQKVSEHSRRAGTNDRQNIKPAVFQETLQPAKSAIKKQAENHTNIS